MENPKKVKKTKLKTVIDKPEQVAPLQKPLSEEEKAKIEQQKQLQNIRFYLEQETKKKINAKVGDCRDLSRILKEYLSSYIIIGFDVTGEQVFMRVSETEILTRALDDLFVEQMLKFQIQKSRRFNNLG